ncbi:MAG: adenylate/guanylate cyclase domain-containing protein [Actinomycetota bacterium]|nr:adenylate/guanylate cyclase domain-containing protein [Actinomycetota bacterium]
MIQAETKYAQADDGVHIAYQGFGVGAYDILFVPWQISHLDLMWREPAYVRWIERLAQLGRVIVIDRRGVGLSDRLSPDDLPPAEVLAEDLGVVLEAAGATKPILFGFAEGGQICSLFAAMHPQRIQALMTYAMWTHVRDEDRPEWEQWIEWASPRWGSAEHAISDAREVFPSRAGDEAYLARVGEITRASLSPGAVRPLFEVSLGLDVRGVLPTITVPTLVMHRERDSAQPVELLQEAAGLIPGAQHVELPGIDHWYTAEPQEPMFDAIGSFIETLGGAKRTSTRRLATVLFTDIVGSTQRSAELGDLAWKQTLESHHRILRAALEHYGGREISTAGDGFFATFDGSAAAARCAIEAARDVRTLGLEIRSGVHTGEVETIDAEIGGLGVTIGARIGALAGSSEVLASSTVKDLAAGSGLTFEDAGEHELKGVPDRWHLYRVLG